MSGLWGQGRSLRPRFKTNDAMTRLSEDEIRDALSGCTIGREIFVLETTTSTNDSVLERTSPSTLEGLVVFAERQTAGRGQRTNSWESAAGKGLWFSFLLRPKINIGASAQLAEWAARTVAGTISKGFALLATVKLPNDVIVAGKKIAGTLVEMRAQKNAPHIAIIGIGVNVNHQPEDFSEELRPRAISLAMALDRSAKGRIGRGEQVDRHQFAVALLKNLDRSYREAFAR
jgi:BirA family transcriptional regulator, biotin operon repressor / biotin---[acetyl-CoA-carboxylase] ligase